MRAPVPIPLQLADAQSRAVSNELCVNAFAEPVQGKATAVLRYHPGLTSFATGGGTYRGGVQIAGTLYIVAGESLRKVSSQGNVTVLGTIPGGGDCMLEGDASQLVILDASGNSWVWNGTAVAQITDPDYQTASSVAFLNGTTLWSAASSDLFFWSTVSDATMIDGLDIATAESKPDPLRRVYIYRNEPYMMGSESLERWFDAGSNDTPYQRAGDVLIDVGLAGAYAVTSQSDVMAWLAHDGTVRMLEQGAAVRISNDAVERRINGDRTRGIAGWSDLTKVRAFSYVYRGHLFLTFRHPDGCVQFDLTTKFWTLRRTYPSQTWQVVDAIFAHGRYLLFAADGTVYDLDETTRYENSQQIEWVAITPTLYADNQRFIVDMVEFVFDFGRGGLTTTPVVTVEASDDGYVFEQIDDLSLGLAGQYDLIAKLWNEGQTTSRTYMLTVTDDVLVTLMSMNAATRPCNG